MNKRWMISFVVLVVGFNVYASGNSDKHTKALAAQTTATEQAGAPSAVEHGDEATHAEQATTRTAEEAAHTQQQEDHTMPEAVHEAAGHTHGNAMSGDHGVPAAAAAVTNPILTSAESIRKGATIFSQSCAVCHGVTGEGDGLGAAGLTPKPADLHAEHVQGNSDGALFWIISQGREGTAMPAWNSAFSEEDRWHLINFLRTFPAE